MSALAVDAAATFKARCDSSLSDNVISYTDRTRSPVTVTMSSVPPNRLICPQTRFPKVEISNKMFDEAETRGQKLSPRTFKSADDIVSPHLISTAN